MQRCGFRPASGAGGFPLSIGRISRSFGSEGEPTLFKSSTFMRSVSQSLSPVGHRLFLIVVFSDHLIGMLVWTRNRIGSLDRRFVFDEPLDIEQHGILPPQLS